MTIKRFDGAIARNLGRGASAALAEFAKQHGLAVQYSGGSFNDTEFTVKIKLAVADVTAAATERRTIWEHYAPALGLRTEWLGKRFSFRGETFEITGCEPSRPKYCVRAKSVFGGGEKLFSRDIGRLVEA